MQTWVEQFQAMSGFELAAVLFALAYIYLVGRQHMACWACGFLSTACFTYVFWDATLVFSMLLNVYYMGMAGYGYYQWRQGGQTERTTALPITTWPLNTQIRVIGLTTFAGVGLWWVQALYTSEVANTAWLAQLSLVGGLDAFVTAFSVVATWMVAHKIYQNWPFWVVINAAAACLYALSGLYLSAGLFVLYVLFSLHGWRQWYVEVQAAR